MNVLLLVIIITFALILIYMGLYEFYFLKKLKQWPEVNCVIVLKEIQKRGEWAMYARIYRSYPYVEYTYSIDGVSYKSNRISIHDYGEFSYDENEAHDFLEQVSKLKSAKVNPRNKKEAYLLDYLLPKSLSHYRALLASGLILMIIAVILIVYI